MSRPGRIRAQGPLMALPALAGLLVFVGVPFLYSIALSFYEVRLGSPRLPRSPGSNITGGCSPIRTSRRPSGARS